MEEIIFHHHFDRVKGIIIGRFIGNSEVEYPQWGKKTTWPELFTSLIKDKNIPLVEFPNFGHVEEHRKLFKILRSKKSKNIYTENLFLSLPIGAKVTLDANPEKPSLKFLEQAVE